MTRDDVQAAVTNCAFELRFASPFGQPEKLPDDSVHPDQPRQINHTFYVLSMVMEHYDAGKIEKAMRWLGFAQGVLWALKISTLAELKEANRPKETS